MPRILQRCDLLNLKLVENGKDINNTIASRYVKQVWSVSISSLNWQVLASGEGSEEGRGLRAMLLIYILTSNLKALNLRSLRKHGGKGLDGVKLGSGFPCEVSYGPKINIDIDIREGVHPPGSGDNILVMLSRNVPSVSFRTSSK